MDTNLFLAVDELFLAALTEGKDVRLHVDGMSMVPTLKPGDTIVVRQVAPHLLEMGDLVVVHREHDLVTHRLVRQKEGQWLTKGDNSHYLDPPITAEMILGKVIAIERKDTGIDLQEASKRSLNRWLASLSCLEADVFRLGHQLRSASRNSAVDRAGMQGSLAARLVSFPFRLAIRLLVR
jgi:signal peptidase I